VKDQAGGPREEKRARQTVKIENDGTTGTMGSKADSEMTCGEAV